MIKIPDKTKPVLVYFPKNTDEIPETLTLQVSRGGATTTITITDIEYKNDYITCMADFSTLDNGEYNYMLSSGETGLIRLGSIKENITIINDGKQEYQFYEG